ncbi:uncharacterized protein [Zea mays]|uniref:uncharacterized protein n=1 Tax=Zea mays TaxID=4577 RepID=UPI0009AA5399|nr:uncharacterized protein LOC103640199 [Zea mays]|eukprot:XP_020400291.1 uncharacterized protein LOC103640199 [Zea mays]
MTTQGGLQPTSNEANMCTNDNGSQLGTRIVDEIMAGKNVFFDLPDKLTGEIWTLKFHCIGAQPGKEIVTVNIDKAYVAFYNVVYIKSKLGYSGRDFLFYKKRCGIDRSRLLALDYIHQEEAMLSDNMDERKISFVLTKDPPSDLEVSITPIKRPRQRTNVDEETIEVSIDAYKEWLAILQHDNPETDLMDDFREDTIKTYKEWLRHQGDLPDILLYERQSNDDLILSDEEIHGSSKPTTNWPSHARRHRKRDPDNDGVFKKEGRGTLKGIAAATKRIKNGDHKLKIEFSSKLGGPVGPNARTFVDEIVLFTKKKAPLIGVKKWKDIELNVRSSIASDVLRRWEFLTNEDAHEKIWSIAKERYKGWRSTLSSTYKAYNSYAERMKNKPEDVDIVEWHYMVLYFGSEKFQRDPETGERS